MAFHFLHIGFNSRAFPWVIPNALIENYFATIPQFDWWRYASQNYVLWTDRPIDEVSNGLHAIQALSNSYIFITEFNVPQAAGWMDAKFWEWLKKPRLQYSNGLPYLPFPPFPPFRR